MKLVIIFTSFSVKFFLSKMSFERFLLFIPVQMRLQQKLSINDVDVDLLQLNPVNIIDDKFIFHYHDQISKLLFKNCEKFHIHYDVKNTVEMNVLL